MSRTRRAYNYQRWRPNWRLPFQWHPWVTCRACHCSFCRDRWRDHRRRRRRKEDERRLLVMEES